MTHPAFRHLGYYASVFQKISLHCPFFAYFRVLTLLRDRISQSCCCLLAHVVDFSCACFCQSFHICVLLQTVHAVLPPWCRLCQVLWPRVQVKTHLGRRKRKSYFFLSFCPFGQVIPKIWQLLLSTEQEKERPHSFSFTPFRFIAT